MVDNVDDVAYLLVGQILLLCEERNERGQGAAEESVFHILHVMAHILLAFYNGGEKMSLSLFHT